MTITGFVTNLEAYNNGQLIGEWVEFPITAEDEAEILERIGNPDEIFFTDWEGENLGEFIGVDEVNELAEDLDAVNADVVAAILEVENCSLREAIERADDVIFYEGQTLDDIACEMVAGMGLPEFAERYFDYEAFERDLGFYGYYEVSNGVIVL